MDSSGCWCIWYFKDTNSKANHNSSQLDIPDITGVFDISKIQIQKQITTDPRTYWKKHLVYLIFQRYKFKSKSQHVYLWEQVRKWCIWYFKDTNSKANHNDRHTRHIELTGVFDISKIQIQKQITTYMLVVVLLMGCIWYFKDTNSKANHNYDARKGFISPVYLIFQRYKFKSKSQLFEWYNTACGWCIWYFKDTNSKANHNQVARLWRLTAVYLIFQRYKFKSKSQLQH